MMILAQIAFPPKATDGFVIASVLLGILGTLFLAYDLLGRENGPLRWFTLVINCALDSAFVLTTIGSIAQYTLWRANRLPHRILGAFGLFLIVVAFGLQGVQPMIDLLNK